MTNDGLIRALVADARPVRRLASPRLRCLAWSGLTLLLLLAATGTLGTRGDLLQRSREPSFLLDGAGLLLLGALSGRSAFQLSVPAPHSAATFGVPLAGALLWLLMLSSRALGAGALEGGAGFACLLRITALGILSLLVGWRMQRRAAPLEAGWTALFLALAAFSFAALASRVLCARDGVSHLLLWHCLPVFALTGAAAVTARRWPWKRRALFGHARREQDRSPNRRGSVPAFLAGELTGARCPRSRSAARWRRYTARCNRRGPRRRLLSRW